MPTINIPPQLSIPFAPDPPTNKVDLPALPALPEALCDFAIRFLKAWPLDEKTRFTLVAELCPGRQGEVQPQSLATRAKSWWEQLFGGGGDGTRDLERIRDFYEADLRTRGWTGTLAGNTPDDIYVNYRELVATPAYAASSADLERIRDFYEADLLKRGWTASLAGNTVEEIQANYQRAVVEATRLSYMQDLMRRGWTGFLFGTTVEEIAANYQAEYNSFYNI